MLISNDSVVNKNGAKACSFLFLFCLTKSHVYLCNCSRQNWQPMPPTLRQASFLHNYTISPGCLISRLYAGLPETNIELFQIKIRTCPFCKELGSHNILVLSKEIKTALVKCVSNFRLFRLRSVIKILSPQTLAVFIVVHISQLAT